MKTIFVDGRAHCADYAADKFERVPGTCGKAPLVDSCITLCLTWVCQWRGAPIFRGPGARSAQVTNPFAAAAAERLASSAVARLQRLRHLAQAQALGFEQHQHVK